MVEGGFDDLADIRLEGKGGIKDHANACLGGGGDSGSINGERG